MHNVYCLSSLSVECSFPNMHRNLQNKRSADFLSTFSLAAYTGSLPNFDTIPKDKAAKDLQVLVFMCTSKMKELRVTSTHLVTASSRCNYESINYLKDSFLTAESNTGASLKNHQESELTHV